MASTIREIKTKPEVMEIWIRLLIITWDNPELGGYPATEKILKEEIHTNNGGSSGVLQVAIDHHTVSNYIQTSLSDVKRNRSDYRQVLPLTKNVIVTTSLPGRIERLNGYYTTQYLQDPTIDKPNITPDQFTVMIRTLLPLILMIALITVTFVSLSFIGAIAALNVYGYIFATILDVGLNYILVDGRIGLYYHSLDPSHWVDINWGDLTLFIGSILLDQLGLAELSGEFYFGMAGKKAEALEKVSDSMKAINSTKEDLTTVEPWSGLLNYLIIDAVLNKNDLGAIKIITKYSVIKLARGIKTMNMLRMRAMLFDTITNTVGPMLPGGTDPILYFIATEIAFGGIMGFWTSALVGSGIGVWSAFGDNYDTGNFQFLSRNQGSNTVAVSRLQILPKVSDFSSAKQISIKMTRY